MNSKPLPNATSSLESEDGRSPSKWPDGETNQSGLDPALASRSQSPENEAAWKTKDISGHIGAVSSISSDLQSSLENKLRARIPKNGSPECDLTLKLETIDLGLPICVVRSRLRLTCDPVISLWPTPQTRDHFPPHKPEYIAEKRAQGHGMSNLNDCVSLLLWPTPRANKWGPADSHGFVPPIHLWPTPTAITNTGGAALCKWGGTRSRELLRGAVGNTVLNGALNPEFPLWLMGYPQEWINCAPSETLSSRKSRRNSSKPT